MAGVRASSMVYQQVSPSRIGLNDLHGHIIVQNGGHTHGRDAIIACLRSGEMFGRADSAELRNGSVSYRTSAAPSSVLLDPIPRNQIKYENCQDVVNNVRP